MTSRDSTLIPWTWVGVSVTLIIVTLALFTGCAGMEYEWVKVNEESPRPWSYLYPADVDWACRRVGASTVGMDRILGCAIPRSDGCTIYLPRNPQKWIVEHEEKHCMGWVHS